MALKVQFLRIRRGVPEVISERTFPGDDEQAASEWAVGVSGSGAWPSQARAVRILGENGRTVVPTMIKAQTTYPGRNSREPRETVPRNTRVATEPRSSSVAIVRRGASRLLEIGQAVSYAEDGKSEIWAGGYEIVGLHPVSGGGMRYAIRSSVDSFDRIVQQHELCENLGARGRGR
jgi:hypothetical protein